MTFLQLLEQKHFGKLNKNWILDYAKSSADFCIQWLIHSLRSNASQYELALSLSFADKWQLGVLSQLEIYLNEILSDKKFQNTDYSETFNLVKTIHQDFSLARIELVIQQLNFLFKATSAIDDDKVNLQIHNVKVPQILLDALLNQTRPHLKDVTLFGADGPGSKHQNIRNNQHFPTPLPNNILELALIERLMATSLNESIAYAEPAVILCYKQNQYYHWHYDALYPHNQSIQQQIDQFGQRAKTVLFYLNDEFIGGETEFKKPFTSIKPKQGNMISFNNCDSSGKRLPESIHRGKELQSGEKWIVTLWFRSKPFWLRNALL